MKHWQLAENGFPRRMCLNLMTPAELSIFNAMQEVEKAGAHPLLTDAVILLGQARDKVADFVELPKLTDEFLAAAEVEANCPISLLAGAPAAADKCIHFEMRAIPPDIQAGIEEALAPHCPRCDGRLACGWWCVSCKTTKDYATQLKRVDDAFNKPDGFDYTMLGLFVGAIIAMIICGGIWLLGNG
jgi:hypothetical protein